MSSKLYNSWQAMKSRCYNTNKHNYYLYGGRGITVCDEWRNSFINFKEWALHNGYSEELTIDRINNDCNYEPSNCRWSTIKVQNINRRSTIMIEYNGVSKPLSYWAKDLNIPRQTIQRRMSKGESFKQAINNEIDRHKKN